MGNEVVGCLDVTGVLSNELLSQQTGCKQLEDERVLPEILTGRVLLYKFLLK